MGECLGDPPSNWYRDPVTGAAIANSTNAVVKVAGTPSSGSNGPTKTAAETAFGGASSSGSSEAPSTQSTKSSRGIVAISRPFSVLLLAPLLGMILV